MSRAALCGTLAFPLLLLAWPVEADTLQDQFLRANQAFLVHDLPRAVQGYRELIDSGVEDPEVSYNLANAYAQLGRQGRAIQFYERALRLRPDDADARHNLRVVRGQLARKLVAQHLDASVEERPPFFRALADGFTSSAVAVAFLVFYLGTFLVLLVRRWLAGGRGASEVGRLATGIALATLAISTLFMGVVFGTKVWADHGAHEAIVVADEAHASAGPGVDFDEAFSLTEGSRVRVLAREGSWVLVRGASGREGWLPRGEVGRI